jgi:transcription initiation factor TFIID subunit TAF12
MENSCWIELVYFIQFQLILLSAEEFVDSVVGFSAMLSKHRNGQNPALEPKDIRLHLGVDVRSF